MRKLALILGAVLFALLASFSLPTIRAFAEHHMGMPAERVRRWTTAEVRELMDESRPWPRYELIDGELIVTPAPSWTHQWAVALLWRALHEYLSREPVGVPMMSPSDLELEEGHITQPDVFTVGPH